MSTAEALAVINRRFTSGNGVPVESAMVTADEWLALCAAIVKQEAAPQSGPIPFAGACRVITELCGKWSASDRPEMDEVIDFVITKVPLAASEADERPALERCQCGYPMPCAKTVPVRFCRAGGTT